MFMDYKLQNMTGWLIISKPASNEFDVIISFRKSIYDKNPVFDLLVSINSTKSKMQYVNTKWPKNLGLWGIPFTHLQR